jgi:hypothetical protein
LAYENQPYLVSSEGSTFCAAGQRLDTLTRRHDAGVALAMARARTYLEEFCTLNASNIGHGCIDLPIRQYGTFKGLAQKDFKLNRRIEANTYKLSLDFCLYSDEKGIFEYFQAERDTSFLLASLRKDGVKVLASRIVGLNTDSQRVRFELEGLVRAKVEFKADVGTGVIALCITNFDTLGTRCYVLRPEQITDKFLHQMGRFVLRQSNTFLDESLIVNSYEPIRDDELTSCNPVISANVPKSADILAFEQADLFASKRVVLRYRDREQVFDSRRAACHLGRKYPADVVIRSRFVSRDHATLGVRGSQFILHDHSRNGIYIKPAGRKMIHLHNAQYRLEGRGVFCVGELITKGHPDLVSYEVR